MERKILRPLAIGITLLGLVGHARVGVADDTACKPLFDAMNRLFSTPSHQYLQQTASPQAAKGELKSVDSEIINTGQVIYVKVDGKWRNSNATGADLQRQEEENRKKAKVTTCRLIREESLDGIPVTLYQAHTETESGTSDEQLWIAKSSSLPQRETIDMDMGDHGGKSRAQIRVTYTDIAAPADVSP